MGPGLFNNRHSYNALARCKHCSTNKLCFSIIIEVVFMIQEILYILAFLNLIFIATAIFKKRNNIAISLAVIEIIIVYFSLTL